MQWYNISKNKDRSVQMKELTLDSKELKRVMHNLYLENLALSEKGLELISTNTPISSSLIKDLLNSGKI